MRRWAYLWGGIVAILAAEAVAQGIAIAPIGPGSQLGMTIEPIGPSSLSPLGPGGVAPAPPIPSTCTGDLDLSTGCPMPMLGVF
jgi:hypothetical protein